MPATYHREELESRRSLPLVIAAIGVPLCGHVAIEMELRTQPLHGATSVDQRADLCTLLNLYRPSLRVLPVEILRVIQPTKKNLAHTISGLNGPVTVLLKCAER